MTKNAWFDPAPGQEQAITRALSQRDDAGTDFHDNGNSGAAITIDYDNGEVQRVVLTASAPTITVINMPVGKFARLKLYLKQDATGTRLLPTFVPAANYGTPGAPALTVTAAKTDVLDLTSVDGGVTLQVLTVVKGL
jgi:hypothetical protein